MPSERSLVERVTWNELLGRRKIYTDQKEITRSNIIDVLKKAYATHRENVSEMDFLINYERGRQPLVREKKIRSDINIEISDNLANYVKDFKLGYFWGSPALLVQRGDNESHKTDAKIDDLGISALNEMLKNGSSIGYEDQKLGEFVEICGIGHRIVDIKSKYEDDKDLFELHTLDSRYAFCVYYDGPTERKVLGVTCGRSSSDSRNRFTCFTETERYEIANWEIMEPVMRNPLGAIPVIEYERAVDRTGAFEREISDMDGLNIMVSDFANDVAQKTQEIWWGNDIELPKDENGKRKTPKSGQWILTNTVSEGSNPKIQALGSSFDSSPTLNAIKYRWNRILQKCKIPTQQDSEGGGSTGTAMDMSTGWSAAEIDALREEQLIKRGKREELDLILRVIKEVPCNILPADDSLRGIHSNDIDFHFNRRKNYDMSIKANTFATLVAHGIHGRHALRFIDAFEDTEQVWLDSKEMIEKYQENEFMQKEDASDSRIMSDNSDQSSNSPILDGMNTSSNKMQA